jgi:hypothetical protein
MRTSSPFHRHRFPAEIISHSVWLCFRFALSFRDVEEMLAQRGVVLTYETIRAWCLKFGQTYANDLDGDLRGLVSSQDKTLNHEPKFQSFSLSGEQQSMFYSGTLRV